MRNIYLLKDVARLTGYSIYTLKYYLNLGLIKEFGRSPVTNFRFFDDAIFNRLDKIKNLRHQRIPLEEIKGLLVEPQAPRSITLTS